MIILGIHGAIGHGKTTFADQLRKIEPNSAPFESSGIISEILDALHDTLTLPYENDPVAFVNRWFMNLPPILSDYLQLEVTTAQLAFTAADVEAEPVRYQKLLEHAAKLQKDPSLASEKITPENKSVYRAGLQGLGGYLVAKVSPTIWYDEIVRRMKIEESNGLSLCVAGGLRFPAEAEVLRRANGVIVEIIRPDVPEQDSQDPTEVFRKRIVTDSQVINNGDQEQLAYLAPQILDDIRAGTLKPSYAAVSLK